jgi:hypothetical protein
MFTEDTKNALLDGDPIAFDRIQLHSGSPGSAGTANVIADTYVAASFAAASGGERVLSAALEFIEGELGALTPNQVVTHMTVWEQDTPPILRGSSTITGSQAANDDGDYRVTIGTKLRLVDPS